MNHIHAAFDGRTLLEKHSMRSLFMALLGLVLMSVPAADVAAQATVRMGFVNSQALIREAPGTSEAEALFQSEMAAPQQEIDRLELNLRRLMEAFQAQQATLQPEARQMRVNEIEGRRADFDTRVQELEQEAAARREALFAPIFERIGEAIELVREEGNYAFIFDTAAGSILSADPGLDLTEVVLGRLQQMANSGNE